jgi:hypothetical protein
MQWQESNTTDEKRAVPPAVLEFAAHFGDAAEKMPIPGRCGHLLFAPKRLLLRRRLQLPSIDTANCLGHISIVTGTCSGLVHNVVLKFLQFRKRVVSAKVELPSVGGPLGNYIHTNRFIRPGGRVAFPDDEKAIVPADEAGLCPSVHRVHHDRAIIHRDVVVLGDDKRDLASLVELHLMYTRTRAQRRGGQN